MLLQVRPSKLRTEKCPHEQRQAQVGVSVPGVQGVGGHTRLKLNRWVMMWHGGPRVPGKDV